MTVPDRVFVNGSIQTMSEERTTTLPTAMACAAGKFTAVGSDTEVLALAGPATEVVDLGGAAVVPGFIETHLHPLMWGLMLAGVDATTNACPTTESVVEALAARAAQTPEGTLVEAWGFDDSLVAEDRGLTVNDLDRASTLHPIMVRHTSNHGIYLNSVALAEAGINEDTPEPDGGIIVRFPDGTPTGELREIPAMAMFSGLMPAADLDAARRAMLRAQDEMARVGVTSFHDLLVPANLYAAYRQMDQDGDLRLRARLYLRSDAPDQLGEIPCATDYLEVGGVKIVSDGSIQLHTAALTEPYHDLGGCHCGEMAIPTGNLAQLVAENHAAGRSVAIHTNGDRAIDLSLDAIDKAQAAYPEQDVAHRLEHVQTLRDDQIRRMTELGVFASIFVNHVYYWGDRHRDRYLGPGRGERISPVASVAAAGLPYALHCDCPVTPVDPLFTMNTAVHRITRDGHVLGPQERASTRQALAGYTSEAARVTREDNVKGRIEPGLWADFVVLDADPLADETHSEGPADLSTLGVRRTVVGGETVYQA
ncbi:amidohydrolase [Rhodococcus sp. ARC_M6]|uniref:amidohydrolase n=1 Tax=Rhodococcus sp. ARC_M6 TaxID=2928852 RepID=UPI001FB403C3|nr:amidohydrolase [Rhodococcus sp. ARC_M6]MCJ0902100.1 amidohydrolase [Rhodococcus sp. ARC_M6]